MLGQVRRRLAAELLYELATIGALYSMLSSVWAIGCVRRSSIVRVPVFKVKRKSRHVACLQRVDRNILVTVARLYDALAGDGFNCTAADSLTAHAVLSSRDVGRDWE